MASRPALGPPRERLAYYGRILRVLVRTEFKLQYEDASLGYLWSLLKPLALFTVLYVVFGRLLRMGVVFEHFPLYLLIGLVLWIFFANSTTLAMTSIVAQGSLLRRLAFPRVIIPISATVNAAITFVISLSAIVVLVAYNRIAPTTEWLGLVPLLAELYAFTLAVSLVLAALYVRFRDVGQIWEVGSQLLFYLTPVIYPLELLPGWAQTVVFLNPFTQIMQDVRGIILYEDRGADVVTSASVYGEGAGRLFPLLVVGTLLLLSLIVFKRDERRFAEQV